MSRFIDIKFYNLLLNTYISFNDDYSFCLLYEYSGKKAFTDYEKELENNRYYRGTVDVDKRTVLFVFEFPEEILEILDLYVDGKYSYLPEKEFIINFLMNKFCVNSNSKIIKILNRDESLKEQIEANLNVKIPDGLDLAEAPDLTNENFTNKKE